MLNQCSVNSAPAFNQAHRFREVAHDAGIIKIYSVKDINSHLLCNRSGIL